MPSSPVQAVFPRLVLLGVGALLAVTVAAAAIGPAAGGRADPPPSPVLAERTLRFEDRDDGAVVALGDGQPVAVFEGEQGFLRGALRGIARNRKTRGLSSESPFNLIAWADGRLTLDDLATHQRYDLEAFGATNAAVFARLLPVRILPGVPPPAPPSR